MPIAKGAADLRHCAVFGFVAQETLSLSYNTLALCPDKECSSCLNGLRPFSGFPHNQSGFAQRRSFFLNASRIGEYQKIVNVKYFSYPCGKDISHGHGKDISHPRGKQISHPSSE